MKKLSKQDLALLVQPFFLMKVQSVALINHSLIPSFPCDVIVSQSVTRLDQFHYCIN